MSTQSIDDDRERKFYAAFGHHFTGFPDVRVRNGEVDIRPTGMDGVYISMPIRDWNLLVGEVARKIRAAGIEQVADTLRSVTDRTVTQSARLAEYAASEGIDW